MLSNIMLRVKKLYKKNMMIINIVSIILLLVFPMAVKSSYLMGIICRVMMYTTLAGSLNIINGYSGQFNIGHAGFFLIGAYTEAILATNYGWSFWPALIIAGIFTSIVGFLISLPTLKLKGIYLSIVTLGFSEIIRIIALNWTPVTGGPMGIKGIPSPTLFGITISGPTEYYYIFLLIGIIFLFLTSRILKSRVGRAWISIREDELAAKSLGVESSKYKSINFMYGAFWAGIVGGAYAPYYKFIASDMFTLDEGFNILSMVIIGGQGTLIGPFVGASIATILAEVFRFASQYRMVIYAVLIIVMMWWRPQGLVGEYDSVLSGNTKRRRRNKKSISQEVGDN